LKDQTESLGVISLNWKRAADTIACIESLKLQTLPDTQFIVVDNGSGEVEVELLKESLPYATLHSIKENLGFAAGFNAGIEKALSLGCDLILILNNDTIACPNMVSTLLKEIASPGTGVVAPVIYYHSNPTVIWSAGGNLLPILATTFVAHSRSEKLKEPKQRTFLSGCCLLIRREVLLSIGGFDERFFMYYEDLDFFVRLLETDWLAKIVPGAKLLHRVSMSSGGEINEKERYLMAYSSVIYYKKHSNRQNFILIILFRGSSFVMNVLRMLVKGNIKGIKAYCKGIADALHVIGKNSEMPKV
jgi:GT2 family glycosyltransferase